MEEMIKSGITHFDKKVTDYQIYVDRELQKQNKKIKSQENYLINSLDSQSKKINDFIEENANTGGGGSKAWKIIQDGTLKGIINANGYTEFYMDSIGEVYGTVLLEITFNNNDKISGLVNFGGLMNGTTYMHLIYDNGIFQGFQDITSGETPIIFGTGRGMYYNSSGLKSIEIIYEEMVGTPPDEKYFKFNVYAR